MTDLSLEDLAGLGDESGGSTEETAETGESLLDLAEWADEKGYLDVLLFGPDGMDMDADVNMDTDTNTDGDAASNGPELTAENIANFGDAVVEEVGDLPLSKVVEFSRSNPEKVNRLIEQNTGGGGAE